MDIEELISRIIDICYRVHLILKPGYLESVYRNALMIELENEGINADKEVTLEVYYKGYLVGNFKADIIVENSVVLELKAVSSLNVQHEIQLVNYLHCTGIDAGLLINFGSDKLEIKRKFRQRLS